MLLAFHILFLSYHKFIYCSQILHDLLPLAWVVATNPPVAHIILSPCKIFFSLQHLCCIYICIIPTLQWFVYTCIIRFLYKGEFFLHFIVNTLWQLRLLWIHKKFDFFSISFTECRYHGRFSAFLIHTYGLCLWY